MVSSLRIKFRKVGSLQFISHLDLCRTMKTTLIRAGIPIWYTEGFNPHPKMVFGLPLSIGAQSECEYLDIRIVEDVSCEEVMDRLNAAVTDEMRILDVYPQDMKFSAIAWAEYRMDFAGDVSSAADILDRPYMITKRSKSGDKEVDMVPYIRSCIFEGSTVRAVMAASSDNYCNPEYLAAAISQRTGVVDYEILRTAVLLADGETNFH